MASHMLAFFQERKRILVLLIRAPHITNCLRFRLAQRYRQGVSKWGLCTNWRTTYQQAFLPVWFSHYLQTHVILPNYSGYRNFNQFLHFIQSIAVDQSTGCHHVKPVTQRLQTITEANCPFFLDFVNHRGWKRVTNVTTNSKKDKILTTTGTTDLTVSFWF